MTLRSVYLLASSLFARTLLAVTCYHPNGQIVTDLDYEPCDQAAAATGTMCCNLNRANFPDTCASNGLCRNGGDTFRDSCTDPTWKSPMCLQQLCTAGFGQLGEDVGNPNGENASKSCELPLPPQMALLLPWDNSLILPTFKATNLDYSQNDVRLTLCKDGSYCCGSHNSTCCTRGEGKHIAEVLSTSSRTTPSHGASKATATADGVNTAADNEEGSPDLSVKGTIGVAVSCSILGVAFIGVAAWYIMRRRRVFNPASMKLQRLGDHEVSSKNHLPSKLCFNILKQIPCRKCTGHVYSKRTVHPSVMSCLGKDPLPSSVVM